MTTPIDREELHTKIKKPYYDNPPTSEIDKDDVQQNIPVEDPTGFLV